MLDKCAHCGEMIVIARPSPNGFIHFGSGNSYCGSSRSTVTGLHAEPEFDVVTGAFHETPDEYLARVRKEA